MDLSEEVFREQMGVCTDAGGVVCGLWQFDVPKPMRDAQVLDKLRFRMGLPNLILSASDLSHLS